MGGKVLDFSRPRIMGVLNVTPDSFYMQGRQWGEKELLTKAATMVEEGADLLDLGGYSSRPGAENISEQEELQRVMPAIGLLKKAYPTMPISIDTFRAQVARKAIEAGADMINDISGGELDENMFETVADCGVPYVLMHMKGSPQTMTQNTSYENIFQEMIDYFQRKIFNLHTLGVSDIVVDLGFGFAKTREQNFSLLNNLEVFKLLGCPLLVGISRKSMIYKTLGISPEEALNGTTVLHTVALLQGVSLLRVHDVKPAAEAIQLVNQLQQMKSNTA